MLLKHLQNLLEIQSFSETTPLFEDLGNLKQLKVGKMINVLKQNLIDGRNSRRSSYATRLDAAGNKIVGHQMYGSLPIGPTSKIKNVGVLKKPLLGSIRKATKDTEDEPVRAFALYVDGKAVVFAVGSTYELAGDAREFAFAYDLSMFKDQIAKDKADKIAKATSEWEKEHIKNKEDKVSSYYSTDKNSWGGTRDDGKTSHFYGQATSTRDFKKFLVDLEELAGDKPITCSVVLGDSASRTKAVARYKNKMSKQEIFTGLDALQTRLKEFKLDKTPTVDSVEDLMAAAGKKIKIVTFGGRRWSTEAKDSATVSPLNLLAGKPFSVSYSSAEQASYDSLTVRYKFVKQTGSIVAFSATWTGKDEKGASVSETAVMHPEEYLKDTLKITKLEKQEIMKAILTSLKNNSESHTRSLIKAARKAGQDFPEFAAIEKSLDAGKVKKESATSRQISKILGEAEKERYEKKVKSPFEGGRKTATVTAKHKPLIWENMLGTVYARDFNDSGSTKAAKYFDYDWDAAHEYAGVDKCTDLRISRVKTAYANYPKVGKLVLWGIPKE